MQPLITPGEAKSGFAYSAKYNSKDPYSLTNSTVALLYQAHENLKKYGSVAEDAGTEDRNAKCLLQKLLNRIAQMEVSDQQAAMAVLGNDSF